jgi:hypothetical protein
VHRAGAVESGQVDQEEVVPVGGELYEIRIEAVEGEEDEGGAGGVVALLTEQGTDVFQALEVAGAAAGGRGFGFTEEGDAGAGGLGAFAGGEGEDVHLVFGAGWGVGDFRGADGAGEVAGKDGVGVAARPGAGEVFEVGAEGFWS